MSAAEEHLATRRAAGLFDFSFMSLNEIAGADALAFLQRLQSRSLATVAPGRIVYTLLLNGDGSVFIDATLWRRADGSWWLFTGRRSDFASIAGRAAGFAVRVRERSGELAVLALQGPASGRILSRLIGAEAVLGLKYFRFIDRGSMVIGRLGFSGELGYELLLGATEAPRLREQLLHAGRGDSLVECAFAAADSLRIESGYVLFDREIDGRANPRELGLERLVSAPRSAFAVSKKLLGLEIHDRPAGAGLPLAQVTSECDSPTLQKRIALGFAEPEAARPGTLLRLSDGRRARAARLPFYDAGRRRPRADPF